MPHNVATCWNSTYDMLKFAYTYQAAINILTDDWTLKLREYELSDENWDIVKQLHDSLKVSMSFIILYWSKFCNSFSDLQNHHLEFSIDTPCPAAIIPAMDKMHNELTAAADNPEYSPALQAALSIGKALLNKYYSLSNDSEVYHIAMSTFSWFIPPQPCKLITFDCIQSFTHNINLHTLPSKDGTRNGSILPRQSSRMNSSTYIRTTLLNGQLMTMPLFLRR